MDINKIASIISEDISINNGVVFERDVSGGRAQKKTMDMKRFYDQMWGKLMKTYEKARRLGQSHEESMATLKGKIEGGFQKTGGYEKIPLDKKHKIKEIYNKINSVAGDIPVPDKPEGIRNFADLVSSLEVGEPKKVKVAGRTIDVTVEKPPTAAATPGAEAAAPGPGEAQFFPPGASPAEAEAAAPEAAAPETAATLDPERVGGAAAIEKEKAEALAAAAAKKKQRAAAVAIAQEGPEEAKKVQSGSGIPARKSSARGQVEESMIYNDISVIAENICDINSMNGTISEAISPKIASATLKAYNEKGIKGTETHYDSSESNQFVKLLNAIWTKIVKGNATIDGADLVDISKSFSDGVFNSDQYQKVLHIFTALKDQELPAKMSNQLTDVETPSVEEAGEINQDKLATMKQEDPERYSREVLGVKKGEKSAKQAGGRLNQLVKNARVGETFRIKIPDTDKKAAGAIAKITVRESIAEDYERLEEISGIMEVIMLN